jgi:hypothetical protein
MASETILWAVKVGEPDWDEQVITTQGDKIEEAKAWAAANGFDRFRVAKVDMGAAPDFAGTVRQLR